MTYTILPQTLHITTRWETCELSPYLDNDGTWHIGYGHGNAHGFAPFVDENTRLKDQDEALAILNAEMNEHYAPQLAKLLEKKGIEVNNYQFNGLLDIVFNRGIGHLAGPDAGSKEFHVPSKCWYMMQQTHEEYFMAKACNAIVFSNVEGYTPLNVAKHRVTGVPTELLGLTQRRIDDASLFQYKD